MPNMPNWQDQISAVIAAPIPFAIALVVFGVVFWRVFDWRYRAVIDKMKELSELSRMEVGYWKDAAARSASQLSEQLESAEKMKEEQPAEAKAFLDKARQTLSRMNSELTELDKANTSPYSYFLHLKDLNRSDIKWSSSAITTPGATQPTAPDKQ
jgi:hypothetical protein